LNHTQEIGYLRLIWQNINNLLPDSNPKSCVSFDCEPSLAFHIRDRAFNDHWHPVKQGSKMDGYFGIFSLKNHTLRVFCQDGEANSERNGFCYDSKGFKIIFIGFDAIGFLKIGGG
jgi:hypothetical protein